MLFCQSQHHSSKILELISCYKTMTYYVRAMFQPCCYGITYRLSSTLLYVFIPWIDLHTSRVSRAVLSQENKVALALPFVIRSSRNLESLTICKIAFACSTMSDGLQNLSLILLAICQFFEIAIDHKFDHLFKGVLRFPANLTLDFIN
jgi:hypothetical protein